MSVITGTIRGRATVEASSTPKVYNVAVPLANTEVSQTLSSSTKKFLIRVRGIARLKLGFAPGESATNYVTIPKGCNYCVDELDFDGIIYFQCNTAAQVVEILEWT